jgi:hypothetical protein
VYADGQSGAKAEIRQSPAGRVFTNSGGAPASDYGGDAASRNRHRLTSRELQSFVDISYSYCYVNYSITSRAYATAAQAEDSVACLAVRGQWRYWRMCDDGGHRAWVQGARPWIRFELEQEQPLPSGAARGEHSENFLDGTKLPISLKTKGRGGRFRETKLRFAPSADAKQEEALARRFS